MAATFVRIRAGLLDPKHVAAIGSAVWLYLWLHSRVRFKGEAVGCTAPEEPYTHDEAAAALGVSKRQVQRWFDTLAAGDAPYVLARRVRYGLAVTITKYGCPARVDTADQSGVDTSDHSEPIQSGHSRSQEWTSTVIKSGHDRHPLPGARARTSKQEIQEIQEPLLTERDAPAAPDAPRAVPKPNRYGEVIDAIRARGLEYARDERDAAAVKRSDLAPALIAEVYEAIARGTWGDDYNRRNLSVRHAIACFNAYRSARALPPAPGRRKTGSSSSSRVDDVFGRQGIFDEPSGYAAAGGRPRAAVGYREVGGGVPGQLLG